MFFNIYLESNNTFQVIKIDNSYIIKNNKDDIVSGFYYQILKPNLNIEEKD